MCLPGCKKSSEREAPARYPQKSPAPQKPTKAHGSVSPRRPRTTSPASPAAMMTASIGASETMICMNRRPTPSGWANAKSLAPLVDASQIPGSHQKAFTVSTMTGINHAAR